MIVKTKLREEAIMMRRAGKTYSEILSVVPVAKSTLSLWLRSVGLAKAQKQKITEKRIQGAMRGAIARRTQRKKTQEEIWSKSEGEIGKISKRELWLIGTALYWAEGAKEKESSPGAKMSFTNMDSKMIKVFLIWLSMCDIKKEDIVFHIYLHDTKRGEVDNVRKHWASITGFPVSSFDKVYFKKSKIKTIRKNIGENYFGVLRVIVRQSSSFLRRIQGWTNGLYEGINKY